MNAILHTGEVLINGENVQDLLITSNFLNVLSVQKACCDFIKANLDVFNCLDVYIFADIQGCGELRADSKLFITQHFLEVALQVRKVKQLAQPSCIFQPESKTSPLNSSIYLLTFITMVRWF